MHTTLRAALILTACWSTATAQTTWVVDQAGGAGAHFTDLPPAFAAAADGDTVLVRRGSYSPGKVTTGIRLLCEPGVTTLALEVDGVGAGRSFLCKGLTARSLGLFGLLTSSLTVRNCSGQLHFEGCTFSASTSPTNPNAIAVVIDGAHHVTFANSSLNTIGATDSILSFSDCRVTGMMEAPGLHLQNSHLLFADGEILGGDALKGFGGTPAPAIRSTGSTILVTGRDATTRIAAGGVCPLFPASCAITGPAIVGGPRLLLDPRVRVQGPIAGVLFPTITHVPALTASGAGPGGTTRADLVTQPGSLYALVAGLPTGPIPTAFGPLWVSTSLVVLAAGTTVTGQVSFQTTVGPAFNPSEQVLTYQALVQTPGGSLQLSNPAMVILF